MPKFTVIEGGVPDGAPPPVVWNRAPLQGSLRALLILDSGDPWEPITLAYDVGAAYLVGIRNIRLPADAATFQAWQDGARADGLQVVDQRSPAPLLAGGISMAQTVELELRRREARRDCAPLPQGSLFDEVRRNQKELF